MGDIPVGHHIPSAVKLVEVVQRPGTGTVGIHTLGTEASLVAD